MSAPAISAPFFVGAYPLTRVRSISVDGKVLAHVNQAFGDAEKLALKMAAAEELYEVLSEMTARYAALDARLIANQPGNALNGTIRRARAALAKATPEETGDAGDQVRYRDNYTYEGCDP